MNKNSNKITISGCGLSGMITALKFASVGMPVTIIERQSVDDARFLNDCRTTALTNSSKRFFESINVWEKLVEYTGPIDEIYVVDNKSDNMIHFDSKEILQEDRMGYLIPNKDFKKCLLEQVRSNESITLLNSTDYKLRESLHDNVVLELKNGDLYNTDLMIICDGRYSEIRAKYFSNKVEKDYKQFAVVFDVHHQKEHKCIAVEHFMKTGPFAILPLKDQNKSSIVWTVDASMREALMNGPKEEFLHHTRKNFGEFLGEVNIEGKIAAYPLSAYVARNYYNNHLVLVADSAHVIHPLAGQGLNQGIKDIDSLVLNILESGISTSTLKKYEKERMNDNNHMFRITDGFNSVFSNNSKMLFAGRQIGFKLIESFAPLKKMFMKYAMGRRN